MTKLLEYMLPGIVLAAILTIINATVIPENLHDAVWFDHLLSVLTFACIIVPCVIYYIKMPPGQDTRP